MQKTYNNSGSKVQSDAECVCHHDKCCLVKSSIDKCYFNSFILLKMIPVTILKVKVKIGSVTAEIFLYI